MEIRPLIADLTPVLIIDDEFISMFLRINGTSHFIDGVTDGALEVEVVDSMCSAPYFLKLRRSTWDRLVKAIVQADKEVKEFINNPTINSTTMKKVSEVKLKGDIISCRSKEVLAQQIDEDCEILMAEGGSQVAKKGDYLISIGDNKFCVMPRKVFKAIMETVKEKSTDNRSEELGPES